MRLIRFSLIFASILLFIGCRSINRPEVLAVETNSWVNLSVNRIGISTFYIDRNLVVPDTLKSEFEQTIEQLLESYGYSVQPNENYRTISSELRTNYGPFYDSMTGAKNQSTFDSHRDESLTKFIQEYELDMLLDIYIVRKNVHYKNSTATWDDVVDRFDGATGALGNSGVIPAISLVVKAKNLHTGDVYYRAQGLQVILKKISGREYDIHPSDIELHKKNIERSFIQFNKA